MLNNRVSKAVRLAIAFGAASSATFAGQVMAAGEEGADKVERIEVTGSRIKRTDLETSVPITTIGKAEIGETGTLNIQDILSKSPVALTGSDQSTSAFTTTTVGLNTTELRGLGEARTLVLVNGRRFVSGTIPSAGYGVDLNAIPAKLIERIDILKSASSAVYGSDAVAGVVNIILRDDIEGVELSGQTGISSEGDREKHSVNITAGNTWDTGNAWISMGYDTDKGIKSVDRDFSSFDAFATNDGIIYLGSSYPPQGRITFNDAEGKAHSFNGDGTAFEGALNDRTNNRFNRAQFRQLITPIERKYVSGSLNLEVSDDVTMFTEFQWNNAATNGSTIEPTAVKVNDAIWLNDKGGQGGMSIDSPLIPELLRTNLKNLGVTDLNQTTDFVRRMIEFGPRDTSLERDTVRAAVGFDWDIDGNWMLSTYATYGQTTQTQQNGGQVNVERAAFALDVEEFEGGLRCKNELARMQGCVPLNLFSDGLGQTPISQAAVDYVRSPAKVYGKVEQSVFSAVLSGELPLELSGGNVGIAGGAEYRYESGVAQPGDLAQTGASSTNKAEATEGSFSTTDVFAEASFPVLDSLRIDVAARQSDHSVTGSSFTYNLGAEFRPTETLMLRASYATAVRTPNIANLYGGRSETFRQTGDPCDGLKLDQSDSKSATVRANCLKDAAVVARLEQTGEFTLTQVERQSTGGFQGGNPDVKEETAETFSLGAVWQVSDELSITLDYFDIEIEDAITTILRRTVIERCYDDPNMAVGCNGAYIRSVRGALTDVNTGSSNEDRINTSGYDIDIDYRVDTDYGTFGAQLIATYTDEFVSTSQVTGQENITLGEVETPKIKANINLTYALDDLNVRWKLRHWDSVVDNLNTESAIPWGNEIGSVTYHDISAGYNLTNDTKLIFGINNAFDKQPAILSQGSKYGSTGINTNTRAYDVQGRAYFLNFETKF
ncbi:TonB-dependent receptor domain-containing protein [Pseudoalteromonas luteoviolacea]|uniref:TonB-denpendent receptor n=1 Tax=Pseudoalteromonas luteoviolacea NCIMB 1942 TaxID=1365253 RepID=A0A167I4I8_9GAMM|nr:TonB-dependent receptor [Pseudoalteromonas luteoviolacea]KZN58886.1 hypothetical protein N482_00435 [Pseudoalteromonas luteoviolacea NCIMB 1942]KZW99145.1 TonB-dependent receptor [Pseudoalteromonas luteoviolacea]